VVAGQSQSRRFYSGVGICNWYLHYPSSPPQVLRCPVVHLESGWLVLYIYIYIYIYILEYINTSGLGSFSTPQLFYTCFYNHARRLRLEKLLYIGLSRSANGFFKPLLDPGDGSLLILKPPHGGFRSETAVTWPSRK
jgi:hypothetical protein